jgi:hypothetical protein
MQWNSDLNCRFKTVMSKIGNSSPKLTVSIGYSQTFLSPELLTPPATVQF